MVLEVFIEVLDKIFVDRKRFFNIENVHKIKKVKKQKRSKSVKTARNCRNVPKMLSSRRRENRG